MKIFFLLTTLLFSSSVLAETINYEIYEIASATLVGSGVKEYTNNDIIINQYKNRGQNIVEKFIELEQGYKIGARIFFEPKLTGFGLIAKLKEGDFSWEWYDQVDGYTFRKLQGEKGLVKVSVGGLPMQEFLEEVVFLDDAKLSFCLGGSGKPESHDIIIKKGSILKFD